MTVPGSTIFLTLLAVISLHELLLLAAPGIENAAYTSQDLWAEESVAATWTAPLRRHRRHDEDYSGERAHCGRRHRHRGGPDHWHGQPHGHSRGHSHGRGHSRDFPPGFGPFPQQPFGYGFGPYGPGFQQPGRDFQTPLAPFQDKPEDSSEELPSPTVKTTKVPATSSTTSTTSTTTEDSTLAIDIRSGLS